MKQLAGSMRVVVPALFAILIAGCIPKEAGYDETGHRVRKEGAQTQAQGGRAPGRPAPTGTTDGGATPTQPPEIRIAEPATEVVKESKACAEHMRELLQWTQAAVNEVRAEVRQMSPEEASKYVLEEVRKKHGQDVFTCPITKTAYINEAEKMQKAGYLGVFADARPHPDGTQFVLSFGKSGTALEVMTIEQAKKLYAEAKKESEFRQPTGNSPDAKCFQQINDMARAIQQYIRQNGSFPTGTDSKKLIPELTPFRPLQGDRFWVCPVTKQPYTLSSKVAGKTGEQLQSLMGHKVAILYDSKPHPNGNRCIVTLTGVMRIRSDEWADYEH